ncbi:MAG TPA: respiratory chain complex I subunit 1 family protein [Anaerolineales bacterium]|nr:respiratory chain complex I subunit 1 family protein [Anaerolineales bacterium]
MITIAMILIGLVQAIVLLLVAPLFSGFSRVLRAKMHNRRGPSIFQNYRDITKLMKRQEVVPEQAGWLFRAAPYVIIVSMLLVAAIIPIFTSQSPFGWVGDLILVIYLFALSRFFFVLSGMETGSTFGGIGARRELLVSSLIEPVMLLVLFVVALLASSTNLGVISTKVASGAIPYSTAVWLGTIAFAFASYVEMGKLPFDLAEAEQELQEGPLTEYSGKSLALMKWGIYLRQVVVVALFMAVFIPFGSVLGSPSGLSLIAYAVLAIVIFFLKVAIFYFIVGVLENAVARTRFLNASAVFWTAFAAAILSFVFYLANV